MTKRMDQFLKNWLDGWFNGLMAERIDDLMND